MPRTVPLLGSSLARSRRTAIGFTLIEILVVISIIALLAGLTASHLLSSREQARRATTVGEVEAFDLALENYRSDEGDYPGRTGSTSDAGNAFPELYRALFCAPGPEGPGGRGAPYAKPRSDNIAVRDEETGEWRKAKPSELRRDDIDKYVLDPWRNPYVYRFPGDPETSPVASFGPLPRPMLFSCGRNEAEDLARGEDEGDDIGNW